MIKNAKQHLQSLRDGRQVFLNGQVVADVTTHPAYRNAIESVCIHAARQRDDMARLRDQTAPGTV